MLYPIVRPLASIALKIFFRKINITGLENIPRDKPVILAANHPTAFIEPCVLACFLDRPLYFLVRGNLFKKPIYNWMLRSLRMLPVYRMKDRGYAYVKNNYETFAYCYEALAENKTVMILAEGRTLHEKRLRPIQKGTARIALGTIEQNNDLEIYIVPVGVNYTYADRYRSDTMIDFGEPMLASKYFTQYEEQPNQAIHQFTKELRAALEERIVIIEDVLDEELVEHLLVLDRSERITDFFPTITNDKTPLDSEMEIADKVGAMTQEEKEALSQKTRPYFDLLESLEIQDIDFKKAVNGEKKNALLVALGWLPYILARIFFFPPRWLSRYIVDTRVKAIEFYTSVWIGVGIGATLIYYIFWFLLSLLTGAWWIFGTALFLFLFGYFGVWYREYLKDWLAGRKVAALEEEIKSKLLDGGLVAWWRIERGNSSRLEI